MKIAVLGGAGKVSLGAIQDFVEHESITKVLLADMNMEALKKRESFLNSDKVLIQQIDLNNHDELVRTLDGYDACLNGSSHHFNLKVMQACIESRTHYTDFGGLFHWARKQLDMHDEFQQAGITGIVGSGSAPGIVNVMARYAYDQLDQVRSVKIRDGIVNFNLDDTSFTPPYAIETLLDEFIMNSYEFKEGQFIELEPFSGAEEIDFPAPIGRQTVIHTIHSEVATMPIYFKDKGIQEVSFKLSLPRVFEEKLKFLVKIGMGSDQPVEVKGQQVIPRQVLAAVLKKTEDQALMTQSDVPFKHDDHKALRVEVQGEKAGQSCSYIMDCVISPYAKWPHMSQGVFSVGFPAAVTTRMLASGQIKEKGFFASEAVIDPQIYFAELAKRDIRVFANFIQQI
ncbi:saccharopine dehydrogenase family protein [Brevibacillus ginsengisoli]|uniref:saccharopine dehydrogenase family protein n=1 Tax=Brevibacillus ginsengisoli TaxID=363854 RepID=UPI003CE84869